MKIWSVSYAALSWHTHTELFFTKREAQNFYDRLSYEDSCRKMSMVEDIWGWCARHFDKVINEIIASRDSGDDFTFIHGMVEEIKEAAAHCGLENFSADMIIIREDFDEPVRDYALSIAWYHNDKLHHQLYHIEGLDTSYGCPTIIEQRTR